MGRKEFEEAEAAEIEEARLRYIEETREYKERKRRRVVPAESD